MNAKGVAPGPANPPRIKCVLTQLFTNDQELLNLGETWWKVGPTCRAIGAHARYVLIRCCSRAIGLRR